MTMITAFLFLFFKRCYLFIFEEGEGGRKRGRETLACNPDMCPDWELNL